jgi:hypothetical protein
VGVGSPVFGDGYVNGGEIAKSWEPYP